MPMPLSLSPQQVRERWPRLLAEVRDQRQEITVVEAGVAVARIVPIEVDRDTQRAQVLDRIRKRRAALPAAYAMSDDVQAAIRDGRP